MRVPKVLIEGEILECRDTKTIIDGDWVTARPLWFDGLYLSARISIAWKVFTGKYDAYKWPETQISEALENKSLST